MGCTARHGLATRPNWVRWSAGGGGFLVLALLAVLASCRDETVAPPPPPSGSDFLAVYDARTHSLVFHPPGDGSPFELEAVIHDAPVASAGLEAAVRIRNAGGTTLIGPVGAALFDFAPAGAGVASGGLCDVADSEAPVLPAGACLEDHRDAYGAGGLLEPGRSSEPVTWSLLQNDGDFSFHVRLLSAGLARSGEISGVVYDDRDQDGRRGSGEPGIPGRHVILQLPDSALAGVTSESGRFSFQAPAAGTYVVRSTSSCCTPASGERAVVIAMREARSLTGQGNVDFGCVAAGSAPPPEVVLLEMRPERVDLAPCFPAAACTIPVSSRFVVRFTGRSSCSRLTGFQWRRTFPGWSLVEPWQPDGADSLFVPAGRDTSDDGYFPGTWSVARDTVSVLCEPRLVSPQQGAGTFTFEARVRDGNGRVSEDARSPWRVQLDFSPQTSLQRLSPCDLPTPPPDCAGRDSVPVGWINDGGRWNPPSELWIPFCDGDTLPDRSAVSFFFRGADDPRNRATSETAEVSYTSRYNWRSGDLENRHLPFTPPVTASDIPLPGGGRWHGAMVNLQPCAIDYCFFAAALNEHGRLDASPDSLRFYVDGAPMIDSVTAVHVFVLVPKCTPFWQPILCSDPDSLSFGPDTLMIVGEHIPDAEDPAQWRTPRGLGFNRFQVPLLAYGHDHPRDRDLNEPPDSGQQPARIASWWSSIDCLGPNCADLAYAREGSWTWDVPRWTDAPWQQASEPFLLTVPLDTLCTAPECDWVSMRASLGGRIWGSARWSVQGWDRWASGGVYEGCSTPRLQSETGSVVRPIEDGRRTALVTRDIKILQLADVRPVSGRPRRIPDAALLRRPLQ